jgi:hypothetical protein
MPAVYSQVDSSVDRVDRSSQFYNLPPRFYNQEKSIVMIAAQPDRLDRLEALAEKNLVAIEKLTKDIETQREESKDLGLRFGYYQQSMQSVINLAFSLIASATISVFITVVLKR